MSDGGFAAALTALDTMIELGPRRLPDATVGEARALREHVTQRLALGDGLTVVALVGGTGVGKSALVNRLVGSPLVGEGVRRPTTEHPVALLAHGDQAGSALLDWLGIDERVDTAGALPDEVVLLDLPDHDSVVRRHREAANRLAERVDGLFVVVDPVKYSRADLHEGPLATLTDHAEVVTVVLNRVDELAAEDVERCRVDLQGRLAAGGKQDVAIVAASARTGQGIAELRARLEGLASTRSAARRRLLGDVTELVRRASGEVGRLPQAMPDEARLRGAMVDATDAPRSVAAAATAYRRQARAGVRSPLARLVRVPLRAVTEVARSFGVGDGPPAKATGRPSLARVQHALSAELHLASATGLGHTVLAEAVEELARRAAPELADAVGSVSLQPAPRRWWSLAAAARGMAEAVGTFGAIWLALLGLGAWLRLPPIPTPMLTEVLSWPTALLIGGVAVRVLLGLVTRGLVSVGVRRHRREVGRRIERGLGEVVDRRLLAPYREELERHARLRSSLEAVLGTTPT